MPPTHWPLASCSESAWARGVAVPGTMTCRITGLPRRMFGFELFRKAQSTECHVVRENERKDDHETQNQPHTALSGSTDGGSVRDARLCRPEAGRPRPRPV